MNEWINLGIIQDARGKKWKTFLLKLLGKKPNQTSMRCLPLHSNYQPPSSMELENRVDFLGQKYEAKHVVYVLDVGVLSIEGAKRFRPLGANENSST